ncbi:protein kinase domain containing protein [Theileria equi strain WA]|uniref:non-specific serine/threonine protein kinase n=1 Tax=Theileria equi strain WA TaxID=1537102 RepID=L1LDD6_THEEQ|nr:protein kinase domain containing protein [Theileria equi strain WA]EKX73462.1 protein kinase domain containing protein [Theileria equi strain WA]|eukprot:XP_004832914.1 protein kinase domain containing protein [Theileria equi strain WA]
MGCSCGKTNDSAKSSKFYILGTITKKRSCNIYLAYRSPSHEFGLDYTIITEKVNNADFDYIDNYGSLATNARTYRYLSNSQIRELDELCLNKTLCILKCVKLPEDEYSAQHLKQKVLREESALEALREEEWTVNLYEAFEHIDSVYLCMEYLWRGTLYDYIRYNGSLPLKLVKNFALQILQIIEALHGSCWTHRDITSANIMISKDCKLKLIDFEFAQKLNSDCERMTSFLGTKYYMPPEVYACDPDLGLKSEYGKESDFWYMGVIIYEMVTGYLPFDLRNTDEHSLYKMIKTSPQTLDFTKVKDKNALDLIKGLLTGNTQERLGYTGGTHTIKNHEFFQDIERNTDICIKTIRESDFGMFEV